MIIQNLNILQRRVGFNWYGGKKAQQYQPTYIYPVNQAIFQRGAQKLEKKEEVSLIAELTG